MCKTGLKFHTCILRAKIKKKNSKNPADCFVRASQSFSINLYISHVIRFFLLVNYFL